MKRGYRLILAAVGAQRPPAGPRWRGAGGRRLRWIGRAAEGPGDATVCAAAFPRSALWWLARDPAAPVAATPTAQCQRTRSQGPGGAIRRAQVRALTCPCAHVRCTRLLVITRMRTGEGRRTMTGYARPSEGRFLMNTVAKDPGTASGAMADAISAGTGSRYG